MIRVTRGPPPAGFARRSREWRRRLSAERRNRSDLTAGVFWSLIRDELRPDAAELRKRFRAKCGFCESKMESVSYPHIEHYRPKSRPEYERFMFSWTNWLLSCVRCNQTKRIQFPMHRRVPDLLDPTRDDPLAHLDFNRSTILALSRRGRETIRLVGLDRQPLNGARAIWLTFVDALLLLAVLSQVPAVRQEARNLLIWSMQDDAPFSAMVLAYLKTRTPRLAVPVTPHLRVLEADQVERIRQLVRAHADEINQID